MNNKYEHLGAEYFIFCITVTKPAVFPIPQCPRGTSARVDRGHNYE